tara:strand:+ start:76721 stop:78490 length:1770 start_codon:yes stop_codon:yes gene_type:complete
MQNPLVWKLIDIEQRPESPCAFKFKKDKVWVEKTWKDFKTDVRKMASLLKDFNVQTGDRVAILANSRYEWTVVDFAGQSIGAVIVPVYQSSKYDELEYILNHSEAKVLFLDNLKQYKKWEKARPQCKTVERVMSFDEIKIHPETSIQKASESSSLMSEKEFIESIKKRTLDENATIIYTSGTTGLPKGVLFTHTQITFEAEKTYGIMPVSPEDSSLCFLPFAHVLGRLESWAHVLVGFTLVYAETIEKVADNIKEIKPTILMSVPRIYEKIYGKLEELMGQKSVTKKFFEWGKKCAKIKADSIQNINTPTTLQSIELKLFDLGFAKLVRGVLGGRLKFAISGGAPLSKELAEFFLGCGVTVLEGYGLTETTGALFFNHPDNLKLGTVGLPIEGADIKIAADGEILAKSKNVMKEYYKDPEATAAAMVDGYFATGDIGNIDEDGFLTITDRKKDLIKTAGGKYVAPQKLENLIKLHPLVSNVLIHGDRKKYVVALVTVEKAAVKNFSERNGEDTKQAINSPDQSGIVVESIKVHMRKVNRDLASYETVKKYKILSNDFTIESGELTPSLKVKRKFCDKKYELEINSLYDS